MEDDREDGDHFKSLITCVATGTAVHPDRPLTDEEAEHLGLRHAEHDSEGRE